MSRRRTVVLSAIWFSLIACAASRTAAQTGSFIPSSSVGIVRFHVPETGLKWEGVPQPSKYFDATGRRAAILGRQDGTFESWIYPIKVAHGFDLEFQQDGMIEPASGESCLKELIARPESTTLVYVHPLFTVREICGFPATNPPA